MRALIIATNASNEQHTPVDTDFYQPRGGHEREKLPPNMSMVPFVHPSKLRDCYESSQQIVVPIRPTTQWSAGCTSVQAAQAMARPVIATHTPGLAEYLIDRESGLLVSPDDDRTLAA